MSNPIVYNQSWRILHVGETPVEYHDIGQGPCIVLLHGGQCTAQDWDPVAARLMRCHRVILPDGFVHPHDPWAIWQLLDHLDIENAIIVGHSAGGPTSRTMYRLAPGRVRALIGIDTNTAGPLQLVLKMPNDLFSPKAKAMYDANRDRMLQLRPHHQGDYPSEATLDRRMTAYARSRMSPAERAAARPAPNDMGTIEPEPEPPLLDDRGKFIQCPTLIIQTGRGKIDRDFVTVAYLDENMQAANLQFEVIKEAGHWPWLEDLNAFMTIIERFLQNQEGGFRGQAL